VKTFIGETMAETATVTADSSSSEILASLTPAEKANWRVTGELPEEKPAKEAKPKEEKTEAASSTAANTETPASTSEKTAVETTAAPATAKEEHKPKGAEARIKELLADNKRLAAELETARRTPVAAPAKVEEVAKPHRNDVDKTGRPMYATDEDFEKAHETYLTAKITADVEKRQAKANQELRVAEQNKIIEKRWQNALTIANEKHPDFAQVVDIGDEVKDGKTLKNVFRNKDLKTIKTNGVLDAWILDSEIGAEMLYHFAKNPADIERIQNLGPFAAARELTKLEEKLSGTEPAPPAKKDEPPAESSPRNVSKAPAPATSVAGKGTAPIDEEEAAVKSEDFRRYARVANANDAAKRKAS
jgi:hypothetical protein